mmetsp:Transcript_40087/g.125501  ORF Transcript_40087/g.125501 Transcript_40087/m.125501 type:complete len:102 (+) Transcript_40087:796-1101(+)
MALDSKAGGPERFTELVAEQTPGGMNERALAELRKAGHYENFACVLDFILAALEGREPPADLTWTKPATGPAGAAAKPAWALPLGVGVGLGLVLGLLLGRR